MPSTWVILSLATTIISLLSGLLFFYVGSPLPKVEKKKQVEELVSFVINFFIFIWIGKILVKFPLIFQDPLAVLAYPSNSSAFYLAVLFSILTILYKVKQQKLQVHSFLLSFVPVFLAASFVFEFIQIVWSGHTYTWWYLGLLMLLLLGFILFQGRAWSGNVVILLMIVWSLGQILLAFILPYTTVFGYSMAPWFLILIVIGFFVLMLKNKKRLVS